MVNKHFGISFAVLHIFQNENTSIAINTNKPKQNNTNTQNIFNEYP